MIQPVFKQINQLKRVKQHLKMVTIQHIHTYVSCHRYPDNARKDTVDERKYFTSVTSPEKCGPHIGDSGDDSFYSYKLKIYRRCRYEITTRSEMPV